MARVKVVSLLFLTVAAVGFGGWAAEAEGFSGTVGMEAAFLPGFATDVWLDLDWNIAPVDLGGTVVIGVYPFAFGSLDVYASVGLFDVDRDGFAASAEASLLSEIYPTFGITLSLDIDASYGVFSLWADLDLGVPGFGLSVLLGGEARVFDLDLEDVSLTADLGASTFVIPAADPGFWFDIELGLGVLTVTAETDFTLAPFGLAEQRIEIEIGFDGLSVYAWGSFTGAVDLSAGIGGTYDFP